MRRILVIGSLLLALGLIVAAGITGCDAVGLEGDACSSNEPCGPGEACDPGTGRCLPLAPETSALEVVPPSGNNQGWVAQEFPSPSVGPDGSIQLRLAKSVSVEGGVYASHDLTSVVPAQVVARRTSGITGRPKVQFETSTYAGKRDGTKEKFLLWLNPGHDYAFLVTPLPPFDQDFPPLVLPSLRVDQHLKKDFVLDGDDRAVVVKGQVLQYGGKLPLKIDEPLLSEKETTLDASVRVNAYEPGGSRRSTVGTTDADTGSFTIKVPAGVATYNVKVETAAGGMPIPTLECTNMVLGLATPQQGAQPTQEIKPIELPVFRFPRLFTFEVKGKDSTPVKGAAVTFRTEIDLLADNPGFDNCTASFARTGYSDADGKVKVLLLPGDAKANQEYAVTVVSPSASPFASQWIKTLEIGTGGGDGVSGTIVLDPRYELSGQVVREDTGAPVTGVNLEAQGVAPGTATAKVPTTTTTATTDSEGKYQLYVDPGTYNLSLSPPQNLGLPGIGLTAKVDGDVLGKVFVLPRPRVLVGEVLDPSGAPLPSAKVQMYKLVPEIEKPLTEKATLQAGAVTNTQGRFGLLVP